MNLVEETQNEYVTDGTEDVTELDPHVVRDGREQTQGEYVRFESTMYPASTDDPFAAELSHEPWGLDNDFEHVHPEQAEWWKVLSGELTVAVEGETHRLTEDEEITLPTDVPHRHWNPADRPTRVLWERRPAFRTEEWAESVYALAQAGKTDEEGVPNVLQVAVWIDEYPRETAYPTVAPVALQRATSRILAPIGRALGMKAAYSSETTDWSQ